MDKWDALGNETRAAYLDFNYEKALEGRPQNWQNAAEFLNGFSEEDIKTRLIRLTTKERSLLHHGAVSNPKVGAKSQIAQMTK